MTNLERILNPCVLVCHTFDEHFYMVDALPNISLKRQAEETGKINPHLKYITDAFDTILWHTEYVRA